MTTFGAPIRAAMEKHAGGLIMGALLVTIVGGFFLLKALL